jgi:hypothetical protein
MEIMIQEEAMNVTPKIPCTNEAYHEKYDVQIQELDHGYMVRVGCKSFAIENKETLLNMITKYINNPAEVQKEFFNKTLTIK